MALESRRVRGHRVEDAVAVLYTSGLDALVLENIILEK
jgi:hypothetical protein